MPWGLSIVVLKLFLKKEVEILAMTHLWVVLRLNSTCIVGITIHYEFTAWAIKPYSICSCSVFLLRLTLSVLCSHHILYRTDRVEKHGIQQSPRMTITTKLILNFWATDGGCERDASESVLVHPAGCTRTLSEASRSQPPSVAQKFPRLSQTYSSLGLRELICKVCMSPTEPAADYAYAWDNAIYCNAYEIIPMMSQKEAMVSE